MNKEFWYFSKNETTLGEVDKAFLGGKGAGLVEMARMGLPVPPGFVIPTIFCGKLDLIKMLAGSSAYNVEDWMGTQLGYVPLVSVRSGARVSMPGMMDTILNVGITDEMLDFYIKKLGQRSALDCYRRLIQQYGQTVKNIDPKRFASALKETMASKYGMKELPKHESSLPIPHLVKLIEKYKTVYKTYGGEEFPQQLDAQLEGAIGAVFKSWNSERAKAYRKENKIPDDWGTAVVVQAMVFGNLNDKSCSGVMFTRNPATGSQDGMGEFLPNAQGEEVVSGTATPLNLTELVNWNMKVWDEMTDIALKLEKTLKDMVDLEFTVEDGKLYILQMRAGKRSAQAAFKIAFDMVDEKILTKEEALKRVTGAQYVTLSKAVIDPAFKGEPLATGLAASKGIATGKIWFSSEAAQKNPGGILVTKETTPDDFPGMAVSVGILTQTGGITSHAAVVARGMDKACVVGLTKMNVMTANVQIGNQIISEGNEITIDGNTGNVYFGKVPMVGGKIPHYVNLMIEWGGAENLKYNVMTDDLPSMGEVYVDCTGLKTDGMVKDLVAFLESDCPELTGILSFQREVAFDDSKFLTALAIKSPVNGMSPEQLTGIQALAKSHVGKNWTVVGCPTKVKGLRVHQKLKTLKEFMECEGYFEVDDTLIKLMSAQGVSVDQFAEILKKAGKTMKPITVPKSREQIAFQVFGK